MTQTDAATIRKHIVVEAPVARAFAAFTERFGDFKPAEHNLLAAPIAQTTFEPRVGGHIIDRAADGAECRWARVLAYEPPDRVVFSWDISPRWQIERDPSQTSEVEVRFVAETPQRTRVELEHRVPRPARCWLGERERRRCRRRGLAALPEALRGAARQRALTR